MKNIVLILCVLFLCSSSYAGNIDKLKAVIAAKNAGGADVTAPTITEGATTNIDAAGTLLTIAFSESVSEGASYSDGDWTLACSTTAGLTVAHSTGDGTASWGMAITGGPIQDSGTDTCTLDWAGTEAGVEDDASNDLAAIDPVKTIVNNSTQGGASYLVEESFDGETLCATGEPSNCDNTWVEVDDSGGVADAFNCSAGNCGLVGTYSYSSPDPDSGQNKIRLDFGARDEVWVAFMWYAVTAGPGADGAVFRIVDTGTSDVGSVYWLSSDGSLKIATDGGWTLSAATATKAAAAGLFYVKIRLKKGTGNDAQMEVWLSNNTSSWGSSVSSSDGDVTNQIQYLLFSNYYQHAIAYIVDKVVIDDEDITIEYFQ